MKENTKIQLGNRRSVGPDFLNLIKVVVTDKIPNLSRGTKYTLRKICGEDLWEGLGDGEWRSAGHCMVHLVKTGELPFRIAESRHEYPVYYQLK